MAKYTGLMSGGRVINAGYQEPPVPPSLQQKAPVSHPMVPISPAMMTSIKNSRKGKLPPGLAKYLATRKKGKSA